LKETARAGYEKPEDLLGDDDLFKQLKKALPERPLEPIASAIQKRLSTEAASDAALSRAARLRADATLLALVRSRIVTIWPADIALQNLLIMCRTQAIALVLRRRLRRL